MEPLQSSGWKQRFVSFVLQSKRVWHLLRKPTGDEFKAVAKISALGIVVIGALGFLVSLAMRAVQ
jgi:protein transport protein SEC61 subunit gamma-like protein